MPNSSEIAPFDEKICAVIENTQMYIKTITKLTHLKF